MRYGRFEKPIVRREIGALGLLGLALALAACQVRVTPDGSAYVYSVPAPGTVVVSAPSTSGLNNREFIWSSESPVEANDTACATFDTGLGQPGIALRINGLNPTHGITVTENYTFWAYNVFNFHVWDTSQSPAHTAFGQTTISALPPQPPTDPLSMCARVVGNVVQFVVWVAGMQRPPWGDPTWGGQAVLPIAAPAVGQTGFYVGHIAPGTSMMYSNLTVDGLTNNPIRDDNLMTNRGTSMNLLPRRRPSPCGRARPTRYRGCSAAHRLPLGAGFANRIG